MLPIGSVFSKNPNGIEIVVEGGEKEKQIHHQPVSRPKKGQSLHIFRENCPHGWHGSDPTTFPVDAVQQGKRTDGEIRPLSRLLLVGCFVPYHFVGRAIHQNCHEERNRGSIRMGWIMRRIRRSTALSKVKAVDQDGTSTDLPHDADGLFLVPLSVDLRDIRVLMT